MVETIFNSDIYGQKKVDKLLEQTGIRRDRNLDYTCGIYDEKENLIATGSCFQNTLRCLAVDKDHQGEGFLNKIVSHLMDIQIKRGNSHIFLYTTKKSSVLLKDLGFYEIVCVDDELVFMENRKYGFEEYCYTLEKERTEGERIAAIVMNGNPFTLGHQYLIEKAALENDMVHVFVLSEEVGPIPFAIRKRLICEGTSHLSNIMIHDGGPYIISTSTFPGYFFPDEDAAVITQAKLDVVIFHQIAKRMGIKRRYVGEEKNSHVTSIYNKIMKKYLPLMGIVCKVIPRLMEGEMVISASTVRQAIHDDEFEKVFCMLPESTIKYFLSEEAAPVIDVIKSQENPCHDWRKE
ncbi:MAG: [citrate (pro-3S)-lyase] ligase [Firmicutes bacterium]|nr:[citrate (pro-3S)-lyase] ligase [Bacillota bacterium]